MGSLEREFYGDKTRIGEVSVGGLQKINFLEGAFLGVKHFFRGFLKIF